MPHYHFAWLLQQHHQDLEGLLWDPDLAAALAQFSRLQIHFEALESDELRELDAFFHVNTPANLEFRPGDAEKDQARRRAKVYHPFSAK
jgi:hypothetical protein